MSAVTHMAERIAAGSKLLDDDSPIGSARSPFSKTTGRSANTALNTPPKARHFGWKSYSWLHWRTEGRLLAIQEPPNRKGCAVRDKAKRRHC
jgi:hypothetical protein